MRKVKIITDSTADLPAKISDARGIEVVPLHIMLGDKSFPDDGRLKNEDLFKFAEETGSLPKTVAVTQYQFEEVFKRWLDEDFDIFFTGISSRLSDTVQGAVAAACAVTACAKLGRERVSIVDSLSLSCGTGLLALEAADLADEGAGLKEVTERALALRSRLQASFVIDTLKYLYMGGRCSKLTSIVSGGLNLKPKLELKAGEIVPGSVFMGRDYIDKYCGQLMEHAERIDPKRVFIAQCLTASPEDTRAKIEKAIGPGNVIITDTSPTTSVHCGPGALGIIFINK